MRCTCGVCYDGVIVYCPLHLMAPKLFRICKQLMDKSTPKRIKKFIIILEEQVAVENKRL
jgi:hypothetical protein